MKLLKPEDLEKQGVSILAVQKARSLHYLSREFSRKSDLPKKFLQKALDICQEMAQTGKDSFITETNYSYTIWEEEKPVVSNNPKKSIPTSSQIKVEQAPSITYNQNYNNKSESESKGKSYQPQMNVYIRDAQSEGNLNKSLKANTIDDNNSKLTNNLDISISATKYRGLETTKNINDDKPTNNSSTNNQNMINKKRSYRGVVYE